jgi:hypothetical protein
MKAKFIYEKFQDESDPIADIGIGGFILDKELNKIQEEAHIKWLNLLKNTFVGKTVTGTMHKWGEGGAQWKKYTIKVKLVEDRFFNSEITLTDNDNEHYTVLGREKLYIR